MMNQAALRNSPNDYKSKPQRLAIAQMIGFSALGVLMFFVPFEWAGKRTIAFDHMASYLVRQQRPLAIALLCLLMLYGAFQPFLSGAWHKNATAIVLSFLKMAGLVLAGVYLLGIAPAALMRPDMLPFLFEKLALPVGMIVPIGALILAFLLGFGLLEMIGVLMQPVMRPIFRVPGMAAIDAVASFVGSYSVALLITDRVYAMGQYSAQEAAIIATGFSTVSTAFMVIIAKTLDLMAFWQVYFWATLIITFMVTAISARLPPLASMQEDKAETPAQNTPMTLQKRLHVAVQTGIETAQTTDGAGKILWRHFVDGVVMAAAIVPSILAIGLLGLLLAKYTPLFDGLGLLLLPFTFLAGLPEPFVAAKGLAAGLAEMFLPALLLGDADVLTRFVVAVVSVSSIVFFSGMIPCVLATRIPLSVGTLIIIWLLRTALSIVLAAGLGHLLVFLGYLIP